MPPIVSASPKAPSHLIAQHSRPSSRAHRFAVRETHAAMALLGLLDPGPHPSRAYRRRCEQGLPTEHELPAASAPSRPALCARASLLQASSDSKNPARSPADTIHPPPSTAIRPRAHPTAIAPHLRLDPADRLPPSKPYRKP